MVTIQAERAEERKQVISATVQPVSSIQKSKENNHLKVLSQTLLDDE